MNKLMNKEINLEGEKYFNKMLDLRIHIRGLEASGVISEPITDQLIEMVDNCLRERVNECN